MLFADRLPDWLTVSDPTSLHNFYGVPLQFHDPENYLPWIVPTLCWSAFCAVLLFTLLCLNSIMRKQWVQAEHLTFPIIQLPFEMTQDSGALFRDRRMWTGFVIAGLITFWPASTPSTRRSRTCE